MVFGLASFVKMLPYIRYMEINYPPNLRRMLDNLNNTIVSFSFGLEVTSTVSRDAFVKYPLPGKFDLYQFHSSFIVNYWQTLTALCFILTNYSHTIYHESRCMKGTRLLLAFSFKSSS